MRCLKTTGFIAVFGIIHGMAGLSQAAVPLTSSPQQQQGSIYLQFADGEAQMTGRGVLNGYKGYRHHRSGYRRHSDSWWYPREAFEVKPVLPAVEDRKAVKHRKALPAQHIEWCEEKYRSYQQQDNTYQPYYGARRVCYSPYFKK